MSDGTLVTLVSLLSVVLFVVGVPIFLTIGVTTLEEVYFKTDGDRRQGDRRVA